MIVEKKELINFLKISIIFLILFVICDRAIGYGLHRLYETGEGKHQYSINRANADIIILGSSRAHHHYDARILQDSMKQTCINLGFDGMSIYYHTILLNTYIKAHRPKVVIYDISPYADICDRKDLWGKEQIEMLFPLALKNHILNHEIIKKIDFPAKVGLNIHSYCYNSKLLDILKNFNKSYDTSFNGYSPLYKTNTKLTPNQKNERVEFTISSEKVSCLKEMITTCQERNIHFLLISSPVMQSENKILNDTLLKIIEPFNIQHFNFSNVNPFDKDYTYFADGAHLNDKGANKFTKMVFSKCLKNQSKDNFIQSKHQ